MSKLEKIANLAVWSDCRDERRKKVLAAGMRKKKTSISLHSNLITQLSIKLAFAGFALPPLFLPPMLANNVQPQTNYNILSEIPKDAYKKTESSSNEVRIILKRDIMIQSIPCKSGKVALFHTNGKLKLAILLKNQIIQGLHCKGGSFGWGAFHKVTFHPNGQLESAMLLKDKVIQGIPCMGNHEVAFHANGKLKMAALLKDMRIQGIPCKGGRHGWVEYYNVFFHPNGKIARATLTCDVEIHGKEYKTDTDLEFHEDGRVKSATLRKKRIL